MENKNILISVIMLTYNRESVVEKMIKSILNQTLKSFEFIIVDNGSSDSSGSIAEEYAKTDERIKVIHISKSSIGRGRNVGLSQAKGEYIAFVDDDDTCEKDYLQCLYEMTHNGEIDITICGTDHAAYDVSMVLEPKAALITLLDRKYYNVGFPTKLIRRALFDDRLFRENCRYDDIYLMPQIIGAANKISYWGAPSYKVVRHDNNNSAWTTNHKLITCSILEEYLDVYRKRTEWLIDIYPEDEQVWRYFEWSFMISMVNKIICYEIAECYHIRERLCIELSQNRDSFMKNPRIQDFEIEWMEKYVKL